MAEGRKILLIHPRLESLKAQMPHLGLGIIAALLKRDGHDVVVYDELVLQRATDIARVIQAEKPEVIGVSLYSAIAAENDRLLRRIRDVTRGKTPVVVGGPHATLFAEDVRRTAPVSYICTGEAESVVQDLFAKAREEEVPVIVNGAPADMDKTPPPDFTCFRAHRERVLKYPLQTSRGCPFRCTFCDVKKFTGSTRWRPRPIGACLEELRAAVSTFPRLEKIEVLDDCPTANVRRFKEFLELLARERFPQMLEVDNMRADHVDAELCRLLRKANCNFLTIGVEHADPEMFQSIEKGETLDDVRRAAEIIRKSGISLGLCFVIGLPGDTYKRHLASVAFARRHRADIIYWNALIPYPGTRVREYFERHGRLFPIESNTFPNLDFQPVPPAADEDCFPRELRMKAQFVAIVETSQYLIRSWSDLRRFFDMGRRYGIPNRTLLRSLLGMCTHTLPWLVTHTSRAWLRLMRGTKKLTCALAAPERAERNG